MFCDLNSATDRPRLNAARHSPATSMDVAQIFDPVSCSIGARARGGVTCHPSFSINRSACATIYAAAQTPRIVARMAQDTDQLTHLVYEASLDNSLWPELVLELTEQLQDTQKNLLPEDEASVLTSLNAHFRRAFSISEKILDLQEREDRLTAVLDTFSFGLALIDESGRMLLRNKSMAARPELASLFDEARPPMLTCRQTDTRQNLRAWVAQSNRTETPSALMLERVAAPDDGDALTVLILPRREAVRMGFPASAAAVLLSADAAQSDAMRAFAETHALGPRESELAQAIAKRGDLRSAAADLGLSYETARTYVKRIYEKTGLHSQSELIMAMSHAPLNILRRSEALPEERYGVRRLMKLADGRVLEYFMLGREDGTPVVHFDALAGITIDMVGNPKGVLAHLDRIGVRLITPCRPGGFRSSPHHMTSLTDFAPDVAELMDHLGIDRFAICSVSFGTGTALAVAHALGERVIRVVLSSPSYPAYRPPDWRDLDLFYQMSGILGRKWPSMLRQIIPFLVRSIMQNVDRYFDRYIAKTRSAEDLETLSSPWLRQRMATMLAERTAAGMDGIVDENLLNAQGWDFDLRAITAPVEIFHGNADNVAPCEGGAMLAEDLRCATFQVLAGKGHYHHVRGWPWLMARAAGIDAEPGSAKYDFPAHSDK